MIYKIKFPVVDEINYYIYTIIKITIVVIDFFLRKI